MEFYVEGLRSRTLKSLVPKLGEWCVSTLTNELVRVPNCIFPLVYLNARHFSAVHVLCDALTSTWEV